MALAEAPSAPCAAYCPKEKKFSGRWGVKLCPKAAAKTQLGRLLIKASKTRSHSHGERTSKF